MQPEELSDSEHININEEYGGDDRDDDPRKWH